MAVPFQVVYTTEDASGDRATTAIDVPITFSLSQYGEFAGAMASLLDAFIGGVLVSAALTVNIDLSALTGNAILSTSDVEEVGAFLFTTGEGRPVDVNVPCIIETLEAAGSDNLDQADVDIAALITAVEDGIATTGGTIAPCDRGEDDLVTTTYARSELRNSGKRR